MIEAIVRSKPASGLRAKPRIVSVVNAQVTPQQAATMPPNKGLGAVAARAGGCISSSNMPISSSPT
jgi:hypothetical protein